MIDPSLKRYPERKRELLQAWDSADDLLVTYAQETFSGKNLLILNDSFGALSCSLENATTYTDSFVSAKAIELNSQGRVSAKNDLTRLNGSYDAVLMRVPKNLSFFEDQLCHLSQILKAGTPIVCGVMVKHQASGSFDLLEKIIGPTRTSLAQKKARLIFSEFVKGSNLSPYPKSVKIEGFDKPFLHHSNVFSREKLDIGTRFFLENLPEGEFSRILDLGCGNGIVGIAAKLQNPSAQIIFSDESQMAIQSANANYQSQTGDSKAELIWTHCFENQKPETLDLVLCNPPFHQGHSVGDQIAHQMFTDAKHALKPGGMLRVIGNTHLNYPATLSKLFGDSEIVERNAKFTIVDALKS